MEEKLYTLKKLSTELGIKHSILSTVYLHEDLFLGLFKKKTIPYTDKNGNTRTFPQWIVYDKDLDEFKRRLEQRKMAKYSKKRQFLEDGLGWTRTSAECWANKMTCDNCNLSIFCKTHFKGQTPPIKNKVLKLYTALGEPPQYLIEEIA